LIPSELERGDPLLWHKLSWLQECVENPDAPAGRARKTRQKAHSFREFTTASSTALQQGALLHLWWKGEADRVRLAAELADWNWERLLCRPSLDPGFLPRFRESMVPRRFLLMEYSPGERGPVATPGKAGGEVAPGNLLCRLNLSEEGEILGELLRRSFPREGVRPESASAWVRLLEDSGRFRVLAGEEGLAACVLEAFRCDRGTVLEALAVQPELRRRGLARRLLRDCIEDHRRRSRGDLLLQVEECPEWLPQVYRALGFRERSCYTLWEPGSPPA